MFLKYGLDQRGNMYVPTISSGTVSSETNSVTSPNSSSPACSEPSCPIDERIISDHFIDTVAKKFARRTASYMIQAWLCSRAASPQSIKSKRLFEDALSDNPLEPELARIQDEYVDHLYDQVRKLLYKMKQFRMRETELYLALYYFQQFLIESPSNFSLQFDNYLVVLGSCMILSNKMSADSVFENKTWAKYLDLNLSILNEYEVYVLESLGFAVHIDSQTYSHFVENVESMYF